MDIEALVMDKYIIITGSEGQVGTAFVSHLKDQGYKIIGIDNVPQKNKDIKYFKSDITSKKNIESILIECSDQYIHALLNVAGVAVFTKFEDRTEEELDFVLSVNIKANIFASQLVYKHFFKKQGCGRIINIGSIYGLVSGNMNIYEEGDRRTSEIYGASKAAVISLTQYLSAYMANNNVMVNCISPGGIFNQQNKNFIEKYSSRVPLRRMGTEEELLTTLDFLIDDRSSYITGQNIVVDGGFTVW